MGSVHEAEHEGTGERVAIKLIHTSRLAGRRAGEAASRFRREARAAAVASGENVVRVLEDGVDEETGDLFIVMELLEGEDLQQLLQRTGPLAPHLALRLVGQALRGLQQAHEVGIVHRDIKPGNIFLARQGGGELVVKILDFGIAKVMGDSRDMVGVPGLTTTGNFLGSPLFMSPEQVKSSKHVDLRSDVWAIGSVLYCALTGRAPHEEEVESVGKLILAICQTPARPVHEIAPWIPVPVSQIVGRALAIDPRKRYASAAEMLDAIRPFAPDLTLREDMWQDLPVLVTVRPPPPPPDDGELPPGDTQSEHHPSLAHAETVPQIEAPARLPASPKGNAAFPEGTTVPRFGEAFSETLPSPLSAEAPANRPSSPSPGAPEPRVRSTPPSRRTTYGRTRGAVALGVVLLAGSVVAAVLRPTSGSTRTDHDVSRNSSSSASSSGASPRAEGPALRFRLRISPADAETIVDGTEVEPISGTVELAGAAGSVHEVQLSKNGGAFRTSVVVTEQGLWPPEIALVPLPPSPSTALPPASARSPISRASVGRSPRDAPTPNTPKEPPGAKRQPSEPLPIPKPPEDDLMHDHR